MVFEIALGTTTSIFIGTTKKISQLNWFWRWGSYPVARIASVLYIFIWIWILALLYDDKNSANQLRLSARWKWKLRRKLNVYKGISTDIFTIGWERGFTNTFDLFFEKLTRMTTPSFILIKIVAIVQHDGVDGFRWPYTFD